MQENIKKPLEFLAVFLGIFFLAALFLSIIDFVPEAPKEASAASILSEPQTQPVSQAQVIGEAPVRVRILAANIDTVIQNPVSSDIKTLDDALLKGAARYPESALLGEDATMYLFGHQSYLPAVRNQAFKAFNGLQKLKTGDEIVVSSASKDYHYRVTSIELVNADTAWVDIERGEKKLVLTTCDSFGKKTERYVVKADFVSENSTVSAVFNNLLSKA